MWWSREGWIKLQPRLKDPHKPGKRLYSKDNLVRIFFMKVLQDAGIPAKAASQVINVAKILLKDLDPAQDIFCPEDWKIFGRQSYYLYVANADEYIYVESVDNKTKERVCSKQFGPLELAKNREELAKDGFSGQLTNQLLLEPFDDMQWWFKTMVNLNLLIKIVNRKV
jgi:DNA-binding transcriptional MerR regulator